MHMHTEHSLVQLGRQITNYLVLPIREQAGKKKINLQIEVKQKASQNVCHFLYLINVITDTV